MLAGSADRVPRARGAGSALRLASGLVTAPDGYSADLHFTRNADGSFLGHVHARRGTQQRSAIVGSARIHGGSIRQSLRVARCEDRLCGERAERTIRR